MKITPRAAALLGLVALSLCACEDPDAIRVYSVKHQTPPPMTGGDPHAGHDHGPMEAHPPAAGGLLDWQLPAGWQVSPEARPMREATFTTPSGLEVAVSRFPGDVGGPLANVNRWRGQVGLAPIGQPGLADVLVSVEGAALPVQWVDLAGAQERLLAAMLPTGGETWFWKLQGPSEQVEPLREGFLALLRSLKLGAAPGPGAGPAAPSGPMGPGGPVGPAAPGGPLPFRYQVPAGWSEAPATPPRLLSLAAPGAEVSVTRFPGDVGGALPNLNRWRGQVGLPPLDAIPPDTFRPLAVGGIDSQLLELTGEARAQLTALVPRQGETWFFKLSGDPAAAKAERERFLAFLASVQWEAR